MVPSISVSLLVRSMVTGVSSGVVAASSTPTGASFSGSAIPSIGSTVSVVMPVVSVWLAITSPSWVTRAKSGTGCPPPAAGEAPAAGASNSTVGSKSSARRASCICSISAVAAATSSGVTPAKISSSIIMWLILPISSCDCAGSSMIIATLPSLSVIILSYEKIGLLGPRSLSVPSIDMAFTLP